MLAVAAGTGGWWEGMFGSMRTLLRAMVLVAVAASSAWGQRGATIAGVVLDSTLRPVAGADVLARPGNHRARSDSAGNFTLTGLADGGYTVAARKVGFKPDRWDVKVSKNGRVEVRFVLGIAVASLDTVVVTAAAGCSEYSLDGWGCRKRFGGGLFLDYPDIDERGAHHTADIFRGLPGFRVQLRRTRFGPEPVAVLSNGSGCINSLVNGREITGANRVPTNPLDIAAMEVYVKPDSVPAAYQRHTWPAANLHRTGRCAVVVYWTVWAQQEP